MFDLKNKKPKAVVLCAGRGVRMGIIGEILPKVLVPIKDKPLLDYVIDYWRPLVSEFIFVVGHQKGQIENYVEKLGIKTSFLVQEEPKGIADAILKAESLIDDNFIVILGDCYCHGEFAFPDQFEQGVGIYKTENLEAIKKSYSVEIVNAQLKKVVEKPKEIINDLCGMGFYFFHPKVFEYIKKTSASQLRSEVEITDVIQKMIESNEEIQAIEFSGDYLNVNKPEDLINFIK